MKHSIVDILDQVTVGNVVTITGDAWRGGPKLKVMGIWACECCGTLMPVEERRCKYCNVEKFIAPEKKPDEPIPLHNHPLSGKLGMSHWRDSDNDFTKINSYANHNDQLQNPAASAAVGKVRRNGE